MLCQCWIGYHRFEAINIAKLLKFDAASCPRIMETTLPKPKSSQSFSSTTRSDCWIDAVSILRAMEAFIVGFMWLNYELTACLWISVRGALHCAHLQCAWCYALCLPTVCYLRAVWTLPTISNPVNSQRKALSDKSVVSHLARNFRTSHVIQKFIVVIIGARHIPTSRTSWIQSMLSPIISLISSLILSYHLRLRLPQRSFLQVSQHEPCVRISNRYR